mgnify:CR=1 FL=1
METKSKLPVAMSAARYRRQMFRGANPAHAVNDRRFQGSSVSALDRGQEILIAVLCHHDPAPATRLFTPPARCLFTKELSITRHVLPIDTGPPLPGSVSSA